MQDTNSNLSPEDSSPITHHTSLNPSPEEVWEENHRKITGVIAKSIRDEGALPSRAGLMEATGLSYQTIYNHLENFRDHRLYKESIEHFRMLQDKVLMKMAGLALEGDLKAAKLFFQVINNLHKKGKAKFQDTYVSPLMSISDDNRYLPKSESSEEENDRRIQWENNHREIMKHTDDFMTQQHRLPSQGELATATGLSRQSISKHMNEFTRMPIYKQQMQQFRGIAEELMTDISDKALEGNVQAAKLYFYLINEVYPHPDSVLAPGSMAGLFGMMS